MVGAKAETMINELISTVSKKSIQNFIRQQNRSFIEQTEDLSYLISLESTFSKLTKLGEIEYADTNKLLVFSCRYEGELSSRSARKMQFEIAKKALSADFKDGAVFVFHDATGRFRFSFIRRNYGDKEQKFSNWKRFTYFVEPDAKTNRTFIERVGTCKFDSLDAIQQAFSVEKLTKDFYKELSDWYFWAIKNVSFPNDVNDDTDDEKFNSENIIRLITRLIFAWFLKQKDLIKPELFDPVALTGILTGFEAESETQNNYYRAILQNLFFATLNQEISMRGFAADNGFIKNRTTNNIKNLYRYENEFRDGTEQIMELFSKVPFLNGGLFECLDQKKKEGKTYDWDGFSRNSKHQANIPNILFFGKERKADLSGEYNDKKVKSVKVSGIIEILSRYNFTVEENTPVEVEVALDPELLGKVFENLLGAFNPETQETARKQTGSFYTPREIVNYMVDESLIAYFKTQVPNLSEESLRLMFSYDEQEVVVDETVREELIQAAFHCKILDPACGSGAFPMGILQQMVHLLRKLDPDNLHWNDVVLAQAMKDIESTQQISDEDKEELQTEIENTFDKSLNDPDYARKLHLIENCIYGVDIQTIAVQISKLRFFISLVCEQNHTNVASDNFGIRPLPNLETKFVAANTLIGIDKVEEDMQLFEEDRIKNLIDKLQHVRHRQFLVTNAQQKNELRDKDESLRLEIVTEVQKLYVKRANEDIFKLKMQLHKSEKELDQLNKTPDVTENSVEFTLFGPEKSNIINASENKRTKLKSLITLLNKQITEGSNYSRLESVVKLAQQLTSWNPYDQNTSSQFFDPEWMFGLKEGFDVVIGNPPYGAKLDNLNLYKLLFPETSIGNIDSYKYFIQKGLDLSCNTGILSYITSDSYLEKDYFSDLRQFIIQKASAIFNIKLGDNVFENVSIPTAILFTKKTKSCTIHFADVSSLENHKKIENIILQTIEIQYSTNFTGKKSIFKNTISKDLIELYDQVMGVKVYQIGKGIPKQTNSEIENNSFVSEISHTDEWLPFIDNGIKRYENRSKHKFIKYGKWLAEPRDIRYFINQKVVIREIVNPRVYACYIEDECVIKNTAAVLIQKSKDYDLMFLLGLLNSLFFSFYISTQSPKSNNKSFPSITSALIKKFKIPTSKENIRIRISSFARDITKFKQANPQSDTTALERQIDELVYKLYDLSYEEVLVVDKDFWLSEEEYEQIKIE